jgi:hypothetical protein
MLRGVERGRRNNQRSSRPHGDALPCARNIDYGPDNLPIGVEFLGVSQGVDLTD